MVLMMILIIIFWWCFCGHGVFIWRITYEHLRKCWTVKEGRMNMNWEWMTAVTELGVDPPRRPFLWGVLTHILQTRVNYSSPLRWAREKVVDVWLSDLPFQSQQFIIPHVMVHLVKDQLEMLRRMGERYSKQNVHGTKSHPWIINYEEKTCITREWSSVHHFGEWEIPPIGCSSSWDM